MIVKAQRREERERESRSQRTALMGEAEEADPNFVLRETSALGTREKRV